MTVSQLQEALSHCRPEAPVYVRGQIGFVRSSDVGPMWTLEDPKNIIEFSEVVYHDDPDRNFFVVYIE